MAVLGEAFINVRADMGPFRRDLKTDVQREMDVLEKAYGPKLAKVVSKAISDGAGEGTRKAGETIKKGLDKDLGHKGSSVWLSITGALAGALDDGISALPAEMKAAIVLSLLAVTPLISGAIAGAIGSGVVLGFSGLGLALATQFESVQAFWPGFLSRTRNTLVQAAQPFEKVLLETLSQVEERYMEIGRASCRERV